MALRPAGAAVRPASSAGEVGAPGTLAPVSQPLSSRPTLVPAPGAELRRLGYTASRSISGEFPWVGSGGSGAAAVFVPSADLEPPLPAPEETGPVALEEEEPRRTLELPAELDLGGRPTLEGYLHSGGLDGPHAETVPGVAVHRCSSCSRLLEDPFDRALGMCQGCQLPSSRKRAPGADETADVELPLGPEDGPTVYVSAAALPGPGQGAQGFATPPGAPGEGASPPGGDRRVVIALDDRVVEGVTTRGRPPALAGRRPWLLGAGMALLLVVVTAVTAWLVGRL